MSESIIAEIWKPVVGHEEWYSVSNLGRVRRNATGRILNPSANNYGYKRITIHYNRQIITTVAVHVIVAIAFIGQRPKDKEINHKNGIKTDNRAENLEWVTSSENRQHAMRVLGIDYACPGERHGNAKLTNIAVIDIRSQHAKGITPQRLASQYHVTDRTIRGIVRRESWWHI